jgi:hypothetical protein
VLFLGGALLLVALYLPWQRVSIDFHEFRVDPSFLDVFGSEPFEGWRSTVAPASALAALLLVGLSAVAFARPALTSRLPLGRCALIAAYFGVGVAVDTRSQGELAVTGTEETLRFAYGAYLGIGAATAMLLAALALRGRELRQFRSPFHMAAATLALALLLVLLLSWAHFMEFEFRGIPTAPAQVAAVVAICTPSASRSLALLAGLFAAAAFSAYATSDLELRYGAWLGLGLAICFAIVSLSGGIRRPDLQQIPWTRLVLSAAGLLLLTSFYLPWQEYCYPADTFGPTPGPPSSRTVCVSPSAWRSEAASGAALLAIALILGELGRLRRLPSRNELAAGIVLLVTTLGFQFGHGGEYDLRYGFWIGVACTAVIVALAAARVRPPPLDARLAPIALCLAYLAVVVPTWWGVLDPFGPRRFFWFAPFSWITVAGALLALMLIRLWLELPSDRRLLFFVPAVIAALAGLDLARFETITWGGGIVLGLCALLAMCAFVEERGGLGELRIPEILRIDRL